MDPPEAPAAEGVVRFVSDHRCEPLPASFDAAAGSLRGWRRILQQLGVLGRDARRYGGYSFGNLSVRVGDPSDPPGSRAFLITGTQTSHEAESPLSRFALVEGWALPANRVRSRGETPPSSEALSHAALYDLDPPAGAVFHVHASRLWQRASELALPSTPADAECGTVEIATAITELATGTAAPRGVLSMAGHPDGVLAFGADPAEAGTRLLAQLARAWSE